MIYKGYGNYYKDAYEMNQNLDADGLKLMMSIEEVRNVYGKEEVFNEGFGGNFYEYPSKGIAFSVSTDSDYDLNNKVGDLRISNTEYSVFGIHVGMEESEAFKILLLEGYQESIGENGEKSYAKGCVHIDFTEIENTVRGLRITVKDQQFDPDRIY